MAECRYLVWVIATPHGERVCAYVGCDPAEAGREASRYFNRPGLHKVELEVCELRETRGIEILGRYPGPNSALAAKKRRA